MSNLQRAKLSGLVERLQWHYDEKRNHYYLDFNPLFVLMVYPARNRENKLKWFGRVLACKVVDIFDEFETAEEAQFFVISMAQTMCLSTNKILKEHSQEIH